MNYSISILGESLDLNQKSKIGIHKTLLDLSDLASRGMAITNSIIIPFSKKNDRLLGFPSRIASNNKAFETSPEYILFDSSGIISRGNIVIKSFNNRTGIKIQMAEGYSLWSLAGKRKLNDIVNHEDDFIFNDTNMNSLKTKTSSVFLTALYDSIGNGTNTALDTYVYTRPCINFLPLLNRVVNELGYSLDVSDVGTHTEIEDVGCLSNTNEFYVSDFKRSIDRLSITGIIPLSGWTNVFSKTGNVSLSGGDTLTNNLYKTSYVFKGWVESLNGSQLLFTFGSNIERVLVPPGRTFINFRSDEVEIGTALVISAESTVKLEDTFIYSAIPESAIFDIEGAINIVNYLVLSDYNLPQITYKEFIKVLMRMFFLDLDIDELKKTAKLKYLPNYSQPDSAIDLSNAVDRDIEFESGNLYAQLNVLSYANDEDVSPNLGAAYFNVENSNAQQSKDFLRIGEFSASNELVASGENIVSVKIYNDVDSKRESISDRIVYFSEVGAFGFNAVFNPISFQRLLSNHYSAFINNTKRERVTTLNVYLNHSQYREIIKNPVVYVDFMNATFLITKISDYSRNNLCKLPAIKLN